jgi:hypothetical protein
MTNNDLQNIIEKSKDWVTRNPLRTVDELGKIGSSCSTSGTRCVTIDKNPMRGKEWDKDR